METKKLALILNSGMGTRLAPLTDSCPKCLTEIGKMTLLERQMFYLINEGVNDFIITTGPFHKEIINEIKEKFPETKVKYVRNMLYQKTNYIYSIWLTKDEIINSEYTDILLLHGDLLFNENSAKQLINSENSVIVWEDIPPSKKDFKCTIEGDFINNISVKLIGKTYGLMPFYTLKKENFEAWLNEIKSFINSGYKNCYAEDAFNIVYKEVKLTPCFIFKKDSFCIEIDDHEDLENAKYLMKTYGAYVTSSKKNVNYVLYLWCFLCSYLLIMVVVMYFDKTFK
jgi:phosphoenolpyruvate phosphomutase